MAMERIRNIFHNDEVDSLRELFTEQLRDLYSAETQLIEGLEDMRQQASSQELSSLFAAHLAQTREHKQRLERIFAQLGESPRGKTCRAMKGLLKEANDAAQDAQRPGIRDASLISAAQRTEHYEIAGYGSVLYYARRLQLDDIADMLEMTLDEEYDMDEGLTYMSAELLNLVDDTRPMAASDV